MKHGFNKGRLFQTYLIELFDKCCSDRSAAAKNKKPEVPGSPWQQDEPVHPTLVLQQKCPAPLPAHFVSACQLQLARRYTYACIKKAKVVEEGGTRSRSQEQREQETWQNYPQKGEWWEPELLPTPRGLKEPAYLLEKQQLESPERWVTPSNHRPVERERQTTYSCEWTGKLRNKSHPSPHIFFFFSFLESEDRTLDA